MSVRQRHASPFADVLEFQLPSGFLDAEPPFWYAVVRSASLPAQDYNGAPRGAAADAETRILGSEPAGEGAEGGVFVARYSASLGYITEAWYATREAAAEDIAREFGDDLGPWTPVPADEGELERYVLATVGRSATR